MKLKTSFFNPTVLRKDITRFAPLWGLYTVFMLMVVFLLGLDENEPARFASIAPNITQAMGAVNCVYGGLCALLLFGDLFTSKMAGMLHAMPMRREGWFLTHFTAGMLFCIVPNTLGAVIASMILQQYCYLAFIWLAVMVLQFLFFFSVGAFSAQCAGNKLGAMGIYCLINFLAVLVAFLVVTFYEPVLYGVVMDTEGMLRGSPAVNFCLSPYMNVEYDNMEGIVRFEGFKDTGWTYLWVSVAVGLVFLGSAVVLYRRRQLESAGDLISFRPAAPVFLVIYTLCCGAAFYFLPKMFGIEAEYLFLVLGFGIGFFTGHMLLEKKVNVFQLKKWIGFGALTAAFFLTITIVTIDPFGVTRYVPEADQIKKIHLSPYAAEYYIDNEYVALTDSQDIMAVIDVHKTMVKDRPGTRGETMTFWIRYELKDGRIVTRKYHVPIASSEAQTLKTFYTDFSYVTGAPDVEHILKNADFLEFYGDKSDLPNLVIGDGELDSMYGEEFIAIEVEDMKTSQVVRGLLEAVKADCDAGNMAQMWDFHRDESYAGNLQIMSNNYWILPSRSITIYESCVNTVEYLKNIVYLQNLENENTQEVTQEDVIAGNVPETTATEPVRVS